MAKKGFKFEGKINKDVMVTDKRPSFFKIISSDHLSTNRMLIPPGFKNHILKDIMSDRALLKVTSGESRYVRLIRDAGDVFLKDGWPEFVREHSLGNNEFLLFKYEGNACFNVHIFDVNGLERVISKSDPRSKKHQHPRAPENNQDQPSQQRALKRPSEERFGKGKEKAIKRELPCKEETEERFGKGKEKAIERELPCKEETEERFGKGKEKAIERESPCEEETDLNQSQPRLLRYFLRSSKNV